MAAPYVEVRSSDMRTITAVLMLAFALPAQGAADLTRVPLPNDRAGQLGLLERVRDRRPSQGGPRAPRARRANAARERREMLVVLRRLCRSRFPDVALAAARLAHAREDPQAEQAIARALKLRDAENRREVVSADGARLKAALDTALCNGNRTAIGVARRRFLDPETDPDDATRCAAFVVSMGRELPVTDRLLELLAAKPGRFDTIFRVTMTDTRWTACVRESLRALLERGTPAMIRSAGGALIRQGDRGARRRIERLLDAADLSVATAAFTTLERAGIPLARDRVRRFLDHPDPTVGLTAYLTSCEERADPARVRAYLDRMEPLQLLGFSWSLASEEVFRRASVADLAYERFVSVLPVYPDVACWLLSTRPRPLAVEPLIDAFESSDPTLRLHARDALWKVLTALCPGGEWKREWPGDDEQEARELRTWWARHAPRR